MNKEGKLFSEAHYLRYKELYDNLTVVFSGYNVRYELSCAINSFLELYPYLRKNIVIFDDLSTDDTLDWARTNNIRVITWTKDYLDKYPIQDYVNYYLDKYNQVGYSFKVDIMYNCIFDQCKKKYLLYNDADVIFYDYFLHDMFNEMLNGSKVYADLRTFGNDLMDMQEYREFLGDDLWNQFKLLYFYEDNFKQNVMHRFHLYCGMIDREYFDSIGTKIDNVDSWWLEKLSFPAVSDSGLDFTRKVFVNHIKYSTFSKQFVLHLGFRSSFKRSFDHQQLTFRLDLNEKCEVYNLCTNDNLKGIINENPLLKEMIERLNIHLDNAYNEYKDQLVVIPEDCVVNSISELNGENFSLAISGKNVLEYIKLNVTRILDLYPNFKDSIVIFDDCSTDGTSEWAKENGFKVISWKFFPNDEMNISVRVNKIYTEIMKQVTTKYLSIIDADLIIIDKNYYDSMITNVIHDNVKISVIKDFVRNFRYTNKELDNYLNENDLNDFLDMIKTENDEHFRVWFGLVFMDLNYFKKCNMFFDTFDPNEKDKEEAYSNLLYGYFDSGSKFYYDLLNNDVPTKLFTVDFAKFLHFGGRACYQFDKKNFWGYDNDSKELVHYSLNNCEEEFLHFLKKYDINIELYLIKPEERGNLK